jgi:putative hemolysin
LDPDPASFISLFIGDFSQLFGVVLALLLLLLSALISGAEIAFFSLTPADFVAEEAKRSEKEQIVINLLDKPKKVVGHHSGSQHHD